jgi:hypothetical protein
VVEPKLGRTFSLNSRQCWCYFGSSSSGSGKGPGGGDAMLNTAGTQAVCLACCGAYVCGCVHNLNAGRLSRDRGTQPSVLSTNHVKISPRTPALPLYGDVA